VLSDPLAILHVVASPSPGGIESFVKDMVIELSATGQSVHICFLETAREAGTDETYAEQYLAELKLAGIQYFYLSGNARRLPWRGVKKIRKYVNTNSIQIYHSHLTFGIVFGLLVKVPRVYTHHSVDMRVGRMLFGLLAKLVDQFVGISETCATALSKHARCDVATIINGVDLSRLSAEGSKPRKVLSLVECISIGRICAEKNYELLVRAVSLLPSDVQKRLIVRIAGAGSPELTENLQQAIHDVGLNDVIHLLGSRNDVAKLLASSQLFIMSSSSEGLPIALIEAAVSGLPCIVTRVGGCGEIIEMCQNGVVVESNDAHALATAMEALINDPEAFYEFSTNALARSEIFSIKYAAESHMSIYRELILAFHDGTTSGST